MSSYIRTLQKRGLKRLGYKRQTERVIQTMSGPITVKLGKGEGNILDPHGVDTGSRHWPTRAFAG